MNSVESPSHLEVCTDVSSILMISEPFGPSNLGLLKKRVLNHGVADTSGIPGFAKQTEADNGWHRSVTKTHH